MNGAGVTAPQLTIMELVSAFEDNGSHWASYSVRLSPSHESHVTSAQIGLSLGGCLERSSVALSLSLSSFRPPSELKMLLSPVALPLQQFSFSVELHKSATLASTKDPNGVDSEVEILYVPIFFG